MIEVVCWALAMCVPLGAGLLFGAYVLPWHARRQLRRRYGIDMRPGTRRDRRVETLSLIRPDGDLEILRSRTMRPGETLWLGDLPDGLYELHIVPLVPAPMVAAQLQQHGVHGASTAYAMGEPEVEALAVERGRVIRASELSLDLEPEPEPETSSEDGA